MCSVMHLLVLKQVFLLNLKQESEYDMHYLNIIVIKYKFRYHKIS